MTYFSQKSLLVLVFSVFLFSIGCSPRQDSNKPAEKKIVVWHWMNDRKEVFDQLAKQYK